MKEDDPFAASPNQNQYGGGDGSMNMMNSVPASVPQQQTQGRPPFLQQPPKFENEIFI